MNFLFDPPKLDNFSDYAIYDGAFTVEEVDNIRSWWEEQKIEDASVSGAQGDVNDESFRKTDVQYLTPTSEHMWLFNKITHYISSVNAERYRFDLLGLFEPLQLARYQEGHFFNWHLDFGIGHASTRKLSLSIQLSDDAEYEGGDLQFFVNGKAYNAPRKKGTIVLFPSFVTHRVTPITKGERFSIVGWVNGNPYR